MRADTDALAIIDLVSRKWLATVLVPHGRGVSETVQVVDIQALDPEGLMPAVHARMIAPNSDEQLPILSAVSDNGPQMVSGTTREWMALHALAMHTGRPGTPTDQAHIESFFGHVRASGPTCKPSVTPACWPPSWRPRGPTTTPAGRTPASATPPPTTSTKAPPNRSANHDAKDSPPPARPASPIVDKTPPQRT